MATDSKVADSKYEQYVKDVSAEIANCVQSSGCQPILFIGSGFSKRYFGGPNWDELLAHLATACPLIDKDYAYYKQSMSSPLEIGAEFARLYQEWAWSSGRKKFPAELFSENVPASAYIKFKISEHLREITPNSSRVSKAVHADELAALVKIKPHAIITTNFDKFIEVSRARKRGVATSAPLGAGSDGRGGITRRVMLFAYGEVVWS
jgi:hypothetical protein